MSWTEAGPSCTLKVPKFRLEQKRQWKRWQQIRDCSEETIEIYRIYRKNTSISGNIRWLPLVKSLRWHDSRGSAQMLRKNITMNLKKNKKNCCWFMKSLKLMKHLQIKTENQQPWRTYMMMTIRSGIICTYAKYMKTFNFEKENANFHLLLCHLIWNMFYF